MTSCREADFAHDSEAQAFPTALKLRIIKKTLDFTSEKQVDASLKAQVGCCGGFVECHQMSFGYRPAVTENEHGAQLNEHNNFMFLGLY